MTKAMNKITKVWTAVLAALLSIAPAFASGISDSSSQQSGLSVTANIVNMVAIIATVAFVIVGVLVVIKVRHKRR